MARQTQTVKTDPFEITRNEACELLRQLLDIRFFEEKVFEVISTCLSRPSFLRRN
jgi:hypothetical protein